MGSMEGLSRTVIHFLLLFCIVCKCLASDLEATQKATLKIDASPKLARKIPDTLLGVFFEVSCSFSIDTYLMGFPDFYLVRPE